MIDSFKDEHRWLSNFVNVRIEYNGLFFRSVECAYQAAKCADECDQLQFTTMTSGQAKRAGRRVKMIENWDKIIKNTTMMDLLQQKFKKEPFKSLLTQTGEQELVEGNYWHDNVWGDCTCARCEDIPGQNRLGKMLMKIREEIQ